MKLIKIFFLSLISIMLTACGGEESGLPSQPDLPVTMLSLQLTPAKATIPVGWTQKYVVEALFSDGHVEDVTTDPRIKLHSSDTNIANIDSDGLATGLIPGQVTVTVTSVDNDVTLTNDAILTVTDATVMSLEITPKQAIVPVGVSQQYEAVAILSNGNRFTVTTQPALTWYTDNGAIATISNITSNKGSALGNSIGEVNVTAVGRVGSQEFSDSAKLYVTGAQITELTVTPPSATIPVGTEQAYDAIASFSDGTVRTITAEPNLNWSSGNSSIATTNNTNNKGLTKGVTPGDTTVKATWTTSIQTLSDDATLFVTNLPSKLALEVSPEETVTEGESTPFKAWLTSTDGTRLVEVTKYAGLSWTTDNTDIATIDNSRYSVKGWATGVSTGQTRINASLSINGKILTGESFITVMPFTAKLRITPSNICLNQTPHSLGFPSVATYPMRLEIQDNESSSWVDITASPDVLWSVSGDDFEQSVFNFSFDNLRQVLFSSYLPTAAPPGYYDFVTRTQKEHWLTFTYNYNGKFLSTKALIGAYVEGDKTPLSGPLLGYAPACPDDATDAAK
ncbi:Ig-like domain-containing protein [Aeromonas enteropelogenes]|uniref:Ig-like domain-containing protein n=1 Tax=Aeromonas enteropelogenes TaxID=29489 RepID=UPI003F749486